MPEVATLVKQLSQYLKDYNGATCSTDGGEKTIVFAFSGHGTNENLVVANDGEPLFLKDVVEPLIDPKYIGDICDKIPKFFFVDACRGQKVLKQRAN